MTALFIVALCICSLVLVADAVGAVIEDSKDDRIWLGFNVLALVLALIVMIFS